MIIKKAVSKVMCGLICIMPLLYSYDSIIITVFELGMFIVYIAMNLIEECFVVIKNIFLLFLFYIISLSLIFSLYFQLDSTSMNRSIATVIYILYLIFAQNDDNMIYIKKTYKCVAICCVMFMMLQIFVYLVLHRAIVFQIPFLPLKESLVYAYKYLSLAASYGVGYPRFQGPFSEPSVYAAYVLPLISAYLFGCENICEKNVVKAIVIAMTVLLSTSGLGIVMVVVLFILYAFINFKNKFWTPLILMILICVSIVAYAFIPTMQETVDNLFIVGNNGVSKADYRIYRGIIFYGSLPLINKIVGIGLYNAEKVASLYNIVTTYDRETQAFEYFNGLSQLFIYSGVIGGVLVMIYLFKTIGYRGSLNRKAMFFMYIALIVGTSALFDGCGLIYLTILYVIDKKERYDVNEECV